MSQRQPTRFSYLHVANNLTMGDSGILRAPSLATTGAPASPTAGDMYYDTTLSKFRVYQASGWSNIDGTAAGSLDAAYDGGATVAVDGGAVTLTDSQTSTAGGLLVTKSGIVASSSSNSVVHINSTATHTSTGTMKLLELSCAADSGSQTQIGIEMALPAHGDSGLTITKGSQTITDGDFTISGCGASSATGFAVTSANTSGDGAEFDLDTITSGDAFIINCTTDAVNYLSIQTDDSQIFGINGTDVLSDLPIEIDVDDADAFLVTTASNTEVLSVDTTMDAGDTCVDITSAVTTGTGVKLTAATTTGDALKVFADSATSGNGICVSVASATMGATGSAISVIDSTNAGREIFAVRDDGTTYVYGTAEGTTAMNVVTGDLLVSDGDLTLSGGEVSVTGGTTTTGSDILLTSSMTTAGNAAGTAGALTILANSATTGTVLSVVANAITSGDMLYLDNGGGTLNGGFYINCNDDNLSDFTVGNYGATVITGNASGTDALTLTAGDITLTDGDLTLATGDLTFTDGGFFLTSTDTANSVTVTNNTHTTGSASTGGIVEFQSTTLTTGALLNLELTSAALDGGEYLRCYDITDGGDVFSIKEDGAVTITGVAATDMLTITDGDALIDDGSLTITDSDAASSLVITNNSIGAADLVSISSTGITTTGAMMKINANAVTHDTMILELVSAGDAASTPTGMSVTMADVVTGAAKGIAVDLTKATTTAKGISVTTAVLTTGDMLYLDQGSSDTLTAGSGFYINCNRNNTSDFTVSKYGATTIAGTAAGSSALTLTTGDLVITDTDATTITSVNGTGNIVEIISGGIIGTGKAMLELDGAGAWHANGTGLLISIDGITATNSPYAMRINADGVDAGGFFIDSGGATDSVCHIESSGALKDNQAVLELTWSGTPNNAGTNMLRVDGSGGTNAVKPVLAEIYDNGVSVGLSVSTASIEDMVSFIGTGATGSNSAVLDVTSTATLNVGGNLVRIDGSGATTTSKPVLLEVLDDSVATAATFTSQPTANHVVAVASAGALTNGYAGLMVTSSGALATGGAASAIVISGSPTAGSIAFEITAASDMAAVYAASSAATNDAFYLGHTTGALASGKAVMHVTSSGDPGGDDRYVGHFAYTGSATHESSILFADGGGKDVIGLKVDTDNTIARNSGSLVLYSDVAGTSGPSIIGDLDKGTPAANDELLGIYGYGDEGTSNDDILYAKISLESLIVTDGATEGAIKMSVNDAAATRESFWLTDDTLALGDSAAFTIGSNGSQDLTISTAIDTAGINANEPKIVMVDGASGTITLTAGSGTSVIDSASPTVTSTTQSVGTADEAINVTTSITEITTDGDGTAHTLAAGTEGQHKYIVVVTDGGGNAVITPAALAGTPTAITFADEGDGCHLIFTAAKWHVVGNNGGTIA